MDNTDKHLVFANTLIDYIRTNKLENVSWQDVGCDVFYSTAVCYLCTLNLIFEAEVDAILTDFETGSQDEIVCQTQYGPVRMTRNEKNICVSLLQEEMHTEEAVSRQDTEGEYVWKE